jgi:hypothetical protein
MAIRDVKSLLAKNLAFEIIPRLAGMAKAPLEIEMAFFYRRRFPSDGNTIRLRHC